EKRATTISAQTAARIKELEEQLAQVGPELQAARSATQQAVQRLEAGTQSARDREERLLEQYEEENATMQRELELTRESLQSMIAERDRAAAEGAAAAVALERIREASSRDIDALRTMAAERASDAARNADLHKQAEERLGAAQRDM